MRALERERPAFHSKQFISHVYNKNFASNGEIASHKCARSEAHAASPFAWMPVLMVDPTSKPMMAIQAKLFPQGGELGILPHLQPARCTRSTYARMAGCSTYRPGWGNNFPGFLTPVLT